MINIYSAKTSSFYRGCIQGVCISIDIINPPTCSFCSINCHKLLILVCICVNRFCLKLPETIAKSSAVKLGLLPRKEMNHLNQPLEFAQLLLLVLGSVIHPEKYIWKENLKKLAKEMHWKGLVRKKWFWGHHPQKSPNWKGKIHPEPNLLSPWLC